MARVDGRLKMVSGRYLGSAEDIEAAMQGAVVVPDRTRGKQKRADMRLVGLGLVITCDCGPGRSATSRVQREKPLTRVPGRGSDLRFWLWAILGSNQ